MKKEFNKINQRLNELEEKVFKQDKSSNDYDFEFFLFLVLLTPIHIIFYVGFAIFYAIIKPFKIWFLTKEQKKYYFIKGKFNPCEYMWSSITERGEK